jgi:hypothetical protein
VQSHVRIGQFGVRQADAGLFGGGFEMLLRKLRPDIEQFPIRFEGLRVVAGTEIDVAVRPAGTRQAFLHGIACE